MSKFVIDLIDEIKSLDKVEENFELFVMSIEFDESGEITTYATVEAVTHIEVNSEHEECLLHTSSANASDKHKNLTIKKALEQLNSIEPGYLLCSKEDKSSTTGDDNSNIGNDNPIIGFGENIELKRFFVVCEA